MHKSIVDASEATDICVGRIRGIVLYLSPRNRGGCKPTEKELELLRGRTLTLKPGNYCQEVKAGGGRGVTGNVVVHI